METNKYVYILGHCAFFPLATPLLWWARTDPNFFLPKDFHKSLKTDAIQGVDIHHQLSRLRHGKNLPDAEVELMMRTFAENLQNYDQVIEVGGPRRMIYQLVSLTLDRQMLALVPPHQGGLLPLSLGLLHPQEVIRDCTVDILNELRQYPVRFPIPFRSRLHFVYSPYPAY
jgi:hypothetical protein